MPYRRLFEPIAIGEVTVANRIVNTVHFTHLDEDREIDYLVARASGGAGLIGLQASAGVADYAVGVRGSDAGHSWDLYPISPATAEGIEQFDEMVIPYLRRRGEAIHRAGARCYGQVAHSGATEHGVYLRPTIGPSPVPDPYEAHVPHAVTETEIDQLTLTFAHGIRRVHEAGLDCAEIHAAHGHLLAEFLSPYFNRRTDRWGGSLENRARIVLAIIERAREMVDPAFPIGIRLGFDGDGERRGVTAAELAELVSLLGERVAFVSLSVGNYVGFGGPSERAYVSPWYTEPAYGAAFGARVRQAAGVPVIVAGRINDPALAESLLADGSADMVGMVRSLIADPDWPAKARSGRDDEIRMCLGINECHHAGGRRVPLTCAVNAAAGREQEMTIRRTSTVKSVAVIGAGPAGLEAARVAAQRGHHVYLCDAARQIGGTPRVLARDPNRRNLLDIDAFFESRLAHLGVELLLGNRVTAGELVEFGLDVVVIATGARPLIPEVPGIAEPNVVNCLDVLRGQRPATDRVLVVGGVEGHLAAPTIAEYLTDTGHQVTMISEHLDLAPWAEQGTRVALFARLRRKSVIVRLGTALAQVGDHAAMLVDTFTGEAERLETVTVVLACGSVPNDDLAGELRGRIPEIHVVGDAMAPRRIMHATIEGARAALAI